jgi:AcrR family transcriptional regulator
VPKKTQKKRVRRDKISSHETILKTCLRLIARQGWKGLSFQKIAHRTKMSASNIVYHFPTREALLRALLEQISQNNFRIVAEGLTAEMHAFERLQVHFRKNLLWAKEFPEEAMIVMQVYVEAGHDTEFAKVFQQMIDRAQDRIREYLLAGQRENLFHFEISSERLATALHSLLIGSFIKIMGGRLSQSYQHLESDWPLLLADLVHYKSRRE